MISDTVDMAHVKGQEHVKRALEVAAAGGHHVLLIGPPGSGKTLLVHAAFSILPALTPKEVEEITAVYFQAGRPVPQDGAGPGRPFCTPPTDVTRQQPLPHEVRPFAPTSRSTICAVRGPHTWRARHLRLQGAAGTRDSCQQSPESAKVVRFFYSCQPLTRAGNPRHLYGVPGISPHSPGDTS